MDEDDESSSTEEEMRKKKEATQYTQKFLDGVANEKNKKMKKWQNKETAFGGCKNFNGFLNSDEAF